MAILEIPQIPAPYINYFIPRIFPLISLHWTAPSLLNHRPDPEGEDVEGCVRPTPKKGVGTNRDINGISVRGRSPSVCCATSAGGPTGSRGSCF